MGVRGLKSFIENNADLFEKGHRLHDTQVIIDTSNLICVLQKQSQKHERRDLFGGDMVQFGRYVRDFFENLKRCNIEPILVLDGAQTYEENKSKTAEKHRRALERFLKVMSISKCGFGDFILPASTTNVFRSISTERNLKLVQCMYEADAEIARLSDEFKCPVISNDSDFFLMKLSYGLIPIDSIDFEHTKLHDLEDGSENKVTYRYIECNLFKQEYFARYMPNLDVDNLPLLGTLVGNDFVAAKVFDKICSRLPAQRVHYRHSQGKQFRKVTTKQHEKILKILYFLCDKTRNETINQLCLQVPRENRQRFKEMIKDSLIVYEATKIDDFRRELARLYWRGFSYTYRPSAPDAQSLKDLFEDTTTILFDWLKRAMEHSVLSYRCLELANKNTIFIIGHMDDPQLTSAHSCQIRPMRVMLALMRSSYEDSRACAVYDRDGNSYSRKFVRPLKWLEDYGKLDYTFYDLPTLSFANRRAILLATFHCTSDLFNEHLIVYSEWFEASRAEEFLIVKFLMDFIDFESRDAKLWKHFRQATLLCMIFYFHNYQTDQVLVAKLDETEASADFISTLSKLIKTRRYDKMPTLSTRRKYSCRLMHQVTQLHSSIISFNGLNAFLGDVMTRIQQEGWLNSCLIYNLAEGFHEKTLRIQNAPEIIHNISRFDKKRVRNEYETRCDPSIQEFQ